MKVAILSQEPECYSTVRVKAAAVARGHEVVILNTAHCYINISANLPQVHYYGEQLAQFDAVVPRIDAKITFYGCSVLRQFEMQNTFCLNGSLAISRSRDKLRALQLLSRKNIGLPVTGFAHSPDQIDDLINMVGGTPLIIKLLEGTQGIGVVLAETTSAAKSVIQAFYGLRANILVQEYIAEAKGQDIRCIVLGNKVIAAMMREAPEGDFRANVHRGGRATTVKLTKQERQTAIDAAKCMGLVFAGVDLIRSVRGPLVLEVNSSPGLQGIEAVSEIDIADHVVAYMEKQLVANLPKRGPTA